MNTVLDTLDTLPTLTCEVCDQPPLWRVIYRCCGAIIPVCGRHRRELNDHVVRLLRVGMLCECGHVWARRTPRTDVIREVAL